MIRILALAGLALMVAGIIFWLTSHGHVGTILLSAGGVVCVIAYLAQTRRGRKPLD